MKNFLCVRTALAIAMLLPLSVFSQAIFNANYDTVKFGGPTVTIVNKVGAGTLPGNVVLYQNVITVGSQPIDAVIKTVSLSTGTSISAFDKTGTGASYTNNKDEYFSPQFNFPAGGGSALFYIDLILGGTYNNATQSGTPVTLQNVLVNSYDIDGNGTAGTNQYNEFGGFFTSEVVSNTIVSAAYNDATGLTRFRSTISGNIEDATDPTTRIRLLYEELSHLSLQVGAEGGGTAYFFIDFSVGPNWPSTPTTTSAPQVDLNGSASGKNNTAAFCSASIPFSTSTASINSVANTPSAGATIDRLRVSFSTAAITDGASEQINITGATSDGAINLNFANAAVIPNVVKGGLTYAVSATVANGESVLTFTKSGSAILPLSEAESLLDALAYTNSAAIKTAGNRAFTIKVKDGAMESPAAVYTANGAAINFAQLPADKTIASGTGTNFSITSNGSSFQWQSDPATGTFADIINSATYSGVTAAQLNITNAPLGMTNYWYRCMVSNGTCTATSAAAKLIVTATLPVTWLSFTVKKIEQGTLLQWRTGYEAGTKEYTIQHSLDGIYFTAIGKVSSVNAAGGSAYDFLHSQAAKGRNCYRIQQVDATGKYSYSKMVVFTAEDQTALRIFLNPVTNNQLQFAIKKDEVITLYDATGKVVLQKAVKAGVMMVDMSRYQKGIYTLRSGVETTQVLLQ